MLYRNQCHEYLYGCVVRNRKVVYAVEGLNITFYYSPIEGKWGIGNRGEAIPCMIGDLLYCCSRFGRIFWSEEGKPEGMYLWKEVKGLESLNERLLSSRLVHFGKPVIDIYNEAKIKSGVELKELACLFPGARLSNSGGNMVLFWDEVVGDRMQIWCAEISLERRQGGQIWGNIEWSHAVLTYASRLDRYKVLYDVSVTL